MGNTQSYNRINFETVQYCVNIVNTQPEFSNRTHILINTLGVNEQSCLIGGTIPLDMEELSINKYMKTNPAVNIIVYGRNGLDDTIYKKYKQLQSLGFENISIYVGGLFEWLLLQDIYGDTEFITTSEELDILKYKNIRNYSNSGGNTKLIGN
jgi:hypothetical protein